MAAAGFALLAAAFAQAAPASGASPPSGASSPLAGAEWLTCSSFKSPAGHVHYFDQIVHVYFENGSTRIGAEGAAMLDYLAAHVVLPPGCQVTIGGHADRVGPEGANLALSRRRAEEVRAYLRGRGHDAPIALGAFGEARPMVETADGAPEPQNRRAEIYVAEPRIP